MGRGGFSWKRATGVSKMKSQISRSTGIPLTKSGRKKKVQRIASGGGCLVMLCIFFFVPAAIITVIGLLV